MPEIKPFRALRYDLSNLRKPSEILAPPYDVISPGQRDAFYRRHPHNVIRLILAKEKKGDTASSNQYTRAGATLRDWIQKGILKKDPEPCIYVYAQDYNEESKKKRRVGFIAVMKLGEKHVLKHENTLAGPKKDRMALLKEVRTNLSPIFGLLEDSADSVQKILKKSLSLKPAVDATIDGVRHRLFVESRPELIQRLTQRVGSKPMFIADGHHRFEVAYQFKKEMKKKFPDDREAGWNYVMTYFADYLHNPFKIFPTHRLLRVPKKEGILKNLGTRVRIKKAGNLRSVLSALSKNRQETHDKKYSFGIYTKKEGFHVLTLDEACAPRKNENLADHLDVAVLHKKIIEPCFKIRAVERSKDIDFTRDPAEAKRKVDQGVFDLAMFLRPTSLKEMIVVSKKGLKMPQKSTYFYPKLLSGLAFHSFDDPTTCFVRETDETGGGVTPRSKA